MGRKKDKRKSRSTRLVLSDDPARVRLRALQENLDARRDAIADVDLDIDTLRNALADFEMFYNEALGDEHATLRGIEGYLRHLRQWCELLRSDSVDDLGVRADRIARDRTNDLARRSRSRETETNPQKGPADRRIEAIHSPPQPTEQQNELKTAYRRLARRFHPDLARTEEERLEASKMMVRVNALYREKDLDRLFALAEQVKGGEVEDPSISIEEQIAVLQERLEWFDAVLENLREERNELEQSPTCELMRNFEQATTMRVDLLDQIREELRGRIQVSFGEVEKLMRRLETEVTEYNRKRTHLSEAALARRSHSALERRFDPFADKSLIRAGLAEIATSRVSQAAHDLATEFEDWSEKAPEWLNLLLLAYVSELSPFPLDGLETYDDLELRYDALRSSDGQKQLGEALVDLEEIVEYGVKRATEKVAHLGLRFRRDLHREAMLVAIRSLAVRSSFHRVLGVLGEHEKCTTCHRAVFLLPLFRLRGLDELRAKVCPSCGTTQSRYWLPKGEDVQSVLNPSYLELGLLSEWSFQIANQSIATQLSTAELEQSSVGDLKRRFVQDVLERHEVGVSRAHVVLYDKETRLAERAELHSLETRVFTVKFEGDVDWTERDAVELIRHRVRNRFKQ